MRLPPGGLERALKVDRRVPVRPARDDAVSEDLADRLPQPLRDFDRAALFDPHNGGHSDQASYAALSCALIPKDGEATRMAFELIAARYSYQELTAF
jgi:hypothetical protein